MLRSGLIVACVWQTARADAGRLKEAQDSGCFPDRVDTVYHSDLKDTTTTNGRLRCLNQGLARVSEIRFRLARRRMEADGVGSRGESFR